MLKLYVVRVYETTWTWGDLDEGVIWARTPQEACDAIRAHDPTLAKKTLHVAEAPKEGIVSLAYGPDRSS